MLHSPSEYRTFLFRYHFDGAKWELPITARSLEEARERLHRFQYATYEGELMMTIPVPAGGFFYRLYCSLKNRLSSIRQ